VAGAPTRPVRRILHTSLGATDVLRTLRHDVRPFALVGRWAGGGALAGSAPLRVARADPFGVLASTGVVEPEEDGFVGGGWFGYLGYDMGRRIEVLPPPRPSRPALPAFDLAFYDHVVRYDARADRWWFEALWTPGRADILEERYEFLRRALSSPAPTPRPFSCGDFVSAPGRGPHIAAVARAVEHIAAGDVFQVNLCIRLGSLMDGAPVDLFTAGCERLEPPYAAYLEGPWGALASLSPELYLRRRDRVVTSAPIKGTSPRDGAPALEQRDALLASAKNNAENVMIVDLMRNDLGRVCEPGSIHVPALARPEPHPGVWHLVSEVSGRLREDVDDGDLLRAAFPPGSVTGAPKIRAMELIAELEATPRQAYTGAIGYVSPAAGLELNVVIRTFEFARGRVWLGSGGGIVADSDPETEWLECLVKAEPLLGSVGARLQRESVVAS
jgi:para-aminobenzoate synthetase/4-amino-4-deoxychorismate lyase